MSRIHDTPRTDAVLNTFKGSASKLAADLATHAEILERELVDRAESWRMSSVCRSKEAVIARLELELTAERALADRLAETLDGLDWLAADPPRALAAWKEARR